MQAGDSSSRQLEHRLFRHPDWHQDLPVLTIVTRVEHPPVGRADQDLADACIAGVPEGSPFCGVNDQQIRRTLVSRLDDHSSVKREVPLMSWNVSPLIHHKVSWVTQWAT